MTKRPSLFSVSAAVSEAADPIPGTESMGQGGRGRSLPASRAGKRVLSVYLDPLAWKQLRQLALEGETTNQALGEEAINLLFAKHGLNRSA